MKNIISTVAVFAVLLIVIIVGAYLFQSMRGLDSIRNVDSVIINDIGKALAGDNKSKSPSKDSSSKDKPSLNNTIVSKTDNVSGKSPDIKQAVKDTQKSDANFIDSAKIKDTFQNGIDMFGTLLEANGLSLKKLGENENIKEFIGSGSDTLNLDENVMAEILNNPTLKKIFEAEGMKLDKKNVEKILQGEKVKDFFKTGSLDVDNKTLEKLFEDENIKELLGSMEEKPASNTTKGK